MIKLITLDENGQPVFNPEVRMFVPFKKLIERDKGKNREDGLVDAGDSDGRRKSISTKELCFIYWFVDPRSNTKEAYPNEVAREKKLKAVLGLPDKWKIDEDIKAAIAFYKEQLEEDFDASYLSAHLSAAKKTEEWLKMIDYSERDPKSGKMLFDPLHVAKINKEAGGVIESLKNLREKVFKGQSLSITIRGGGEASEFEDPDLEEDD